ncbi:hypothetical protein CDD83_4185 [Cordyceps sp. RAO-2017]|nr:hypothetical protein CDD83_4185 [Cordyceps sp. RAO-2017]
MASCQLPSHNPDAAAAAVAAAAAAAAIVSIVAASQQQTQFLAKPIDRRGHETKHASDPSILSIATSCPPKHGFAIEPLDNPFRPHLSTLSLTLSLSLPSIPSRKPTTTTERQRRPRLSRRRQVDLLCVYELA